LGSMFAVSLITVSARLIAASTAVSSIFSSLIAPLGKNGNFVAGNLGETAADGEPLGGIALRHLEFAMIHLREQWDMPGQNADLAVDGRNDDRVDDVGIDPRLGRDDFER